MGKALLFLIILSTAGITLFRPYIGSIAYYMLAIFGPQYIWWWNFEGLRVSLIVALSTIGAFLITPVNWNRVATKSSFWLLVLWFQLTASYFFGPYVQETMDVTGGIPYQFWVANCKIFLFYYISVMLLDSLKKVELLSMVIIIAAIYLSYWANDVYLSGQWWRFNMGRLGGPMALGGGSIYGDTNTFAMLFVTGSPFLFYKGLYTSNKLLRYFMWGCIPFIWHAIFLTGSRGGLVGIAVTLFAGILISNRKMLSLLLVPLFIIAYQWQAGSTLKSRSMTITQYEGEKSAEARLETWTAATIMMSNHPFVGVGLGCFQHSMRYYTDKQPREAHNTLLHIGAESGMLASLAYVIIVLLFYKQSLYIKKTLTLGKKYFNKDELDSISCLNDSCFVSFSGLIVCSLFLSLNRYESIYYLLLIMGYLDYHVREKLHQSRLVNREKVTDH